MPLISVITPTFQHGHYLSQAIESVLAQSQKDVELIVIDGGSTDSTLTVLSGYASVRYQSEPDDGYLDALHKGIRLAQGRFIMQCCSSDGYLDTNWLASCSAVLSDNPEISLVWGMPRQLSENGELGDVHYAELFRRGSVDPRTTFRRWLMSGFVLPEGNLCVRREVLLDCLPHVDELDPAVHDPWLVFNLRFQTAGFLAQGLPIIANYGREHPDSITQGDHARYWQRHLWYLSQVARYRQAVLSRRRIHVFRDGLGRPLSRFQPSARDRVQGTMWDWANVGRDVFRSGWSHLPGSMRRRLRRFALSRMAG